MSLLVTLNGQNYILPQTNEVGWGSNLDDYFVAIPAGVLQKTGGSFTLTAETDFGATYGLKSAYYKSRTANVASAGQVRLADTDTIKFRDHLNDADIALDKDSSDNLRWNATKLLLSGAVVNADINASAAIAYSKLALTGSIVNADVNASAAIVRSKLAATESSDVTYASGKGVFFTDSGSKTVKFTAPTTLTNTYAWKLPVDQGGSNQYLTNDGSGNLSWSNAAGTGTVNSGTQYQMAYYATSTNAVSGTSALVTDASGNLFIGATSARTFNGTTPTFQIEGTTVNTARPTVTLNSNSAAGAYFTIAKSRGTTIGSNTIVQNGDFIGGLNFVAANGVDMSAQCAYIFASTAGVPSATSMPTKLEFATTPAGALGSNVAFTLNSDQSAAFASSVAISSTSNTALVVSGSVNGIAPRIVSKNTNATAGQQRIGLVGASGDNGSVSLSLLAGKDASNNSVQMVSADTFVSLGIGAVEYGRQTTGQFLNQDGLVGTPTFSFISDPDTGVYRVGANDLGLAAGGTLAIEVSSTKAIFSGLLLASDGAVGTPSYTFGSDQDTGMYRIGANDLALATGGVKALEIDSSQNATFAGTITTTGIVGSTTNSGAATGNVGQVVESQVTTLTAVGGNGSFGDLTSVTLTAGTWLVTGLVSFSAQGATVGGPWELGLSSHSGTDQTGLVEGVNDIQNNFVPTISSDVAMCIPNYWVKLSGSTIYYLKCRSNFSAGSPKYVGRITCVRIF